MSFIYSRALVEEYSAANCSDIDASALSSENHTPKPFWWHDKTMEPSRHSRFGMTYAPLTESLGAELLTWFAAASRARTSALPEVGPDWTASGQGFGEKWPGLLARFDPSTRTLKTAQLSLLEDLTGCSLTLPQWGLMLDGELYPQPTATPLICGKESGLSGETVPTPTCDSATHRTGRYAQGGMPLTAYIEKFPTPIRNDAEKRGDFDPIRSYGLAGHVKMFPTATATAYKGWSKNHNRAMTDDRLDYTIEREANELGNAGRLNPEFVEWLMGWPIGHTGLEPVATDRLAEWQQQHGIC